MARIATEIGLEYVLDFVRQQRCCRNTVRAVKVYLPVLIGKASSLLVINSIYFSALTNKKTTNILTAR